jgi:hypothetical protein
VTARNFIRLCPVAFSVTHIRLMIALGSTGSFRMHSQCPRRIGSAKGASFEYTFECPTRLVARRPFWGSLASKRH